jgi:hypothetical protein
MYTPAPLLTAAAPTISAVETRMPNEGSAARSQANRGSRRVATSRE